ncbi:uncharacterized protein [Rutidosis leptorrhynchoides]|uniref:uncharacterized protein n=1 Tax=Rutidosis leptorrhynchoides TaxID=125765 RepID=UPI003A991B47
MNALAWNCRGLDNPYKVQALKKFQTVFQPSLIFVSKTKKLASELDYIRNRLQLSGCFAVDRDLNRTGFNGGLALMWADDVTVDIMYFSKNHIDVVVDQKWRITGIYGWPKAKNKWKTKKLLLDLLPLNSLPWMLLGDFNMILDNFEKQEGNPKTLSQLAVFRLAISDCGLSDIPFLGNSFT